MQTTSSCHSSFQMTGIAMLAVALLTSASTVAWSQDFTSRFELGGIFTASHVAPLSNYGPGVAGTVNFSRHIALDAAYSWLPASTQSFPATPQHMMTGFFGAKAGWRTQRFGFFLKARPGFISFGNTIRDITLNFAPTGESVFVRQARQTEKALDLGGVMEYYPARHWALRWDAGDMMVFAEPGVRFIAVGNVPSNFVNVPPGSGQTTHNFLFSTGVHYRF